MSTEYNPIVRTFCRLRAALLRVVDVPRHLVHPDMPLAVLIPVEQRQQVWREFRREGLGIPSLVLTPFDFALSTFTVLKTTLSLAWAVQHPIGLLSFIPLLMLASRLTRHRAVVVPEDGPITIGEWVIYLTHFAEHPDYRFSRNEISLKVRMVVAAALALSLDDVQEHHSLFGLGAA